MARRLSAAQSPLAVLESTLDVAAASVAFEHAARHNPQLIELFHHQMPDSSALHTLAAFFGITSPNPSSTRRFLVDLYWSNQQGDRNRLITAFRTEDDRLLLQALGDLPERLLRRGMNELAPMDLESVGSFYWLESCPDLEEIYLFFRKSEYLSATGIS